MTHVQDSYRLGRVLVLIKQGPLDTPCHVWQGSTMFGYPIRRVDGVRDRETRRVWVERNGPIPPGHDIHHICGRRRCINPDHLEALSRSDHLRRHRSEHQPDGVAAVLATQTDDDRDAVTDHRKVLNTHCKRGHELTPDNVLPHPSGRGRLCKTCRMMKRGRNG